jgi:hypothetical protein
MQRRLNRTDQNVHVDNDLWHHRLSHDLDVVLQEDKRLRDRAQWCVKQRAQRAAQVVRVLLEQVREGALAGDFLYHQKEGALIVASVS